MNNHYSVTGINRLAACESNKERLLLKGVLPLYVKLLQSCSEEEQLIAAQGLWAFGFCKQGRQFIRDEPGCIRGQSFEGHTVLYNNTLSGTISFFFLHNSHRNVRVLEAQLYTYQDSCSP